MPATSKARQYFIFSSLTVQCHEIFDRFAYGFVFAEIIASKVVKIGFSGFNDPTVIENEVQISKTFFLLEVKILYDILLLENLFLKVAVI
jgi:hypothetical protein